MHSQARYSQACHCQVRHCRVRRAEAVRGRAPVRFGFSVPCPAIFRIAPSRLAPSRLPSAPALTLAFLP